MARVVVLVSTLIKPNLAEAIAAGEAPRRDYFELQDMLGCELMSPPPPAGMIYRMLRKLGGTASAMAWAAWLSRHHYDVILTDQEAAGLILALLFKLTRIRRGHVMISHYLTPAKKQILYRLLRAQTHIDVTVCYSSAQEKLARDNLRLNRDQVSLVLHPADSRFWRPIADREEFLADKEMLHQAGIHLPEHAQVVCSAGLEFRDYPTLMEAVKRLPNSVRIVIATASPWSKRKNTAEDVKLPENVQRVALNPQQLRALYRRSQIVAIPLYDVDFQAGSLVAYEAMACGKPVVITRTRGQSDIVREGETGLYVPPGDVNALAEALNQMLSDPALARSLGAKARLIVEEGLNLDSYLAEMVELVHRVAATRSTGQALEEPVVMLKRGVR
jgi:glycosyltransferase involved in cell wall biosynthesis